MAGPLCGYVAVLVALAAGFVWVWRRCTRSPGEATHTWLRNLGVVVSCDDRTYLQSHGIDDILKDAITAVINERPADLRGGLVRRLMHAGRVGSRSAQHQVERAREGLAELPPGLAPVTLDGSLDQSLRSSLISLDTTSVLLPPDTSYLHCPTCEFVTGGDLQEHYQSNHPDLVQSQPLLQVGRYAEYFTREAPPRPVTVDSLLGKAEQFAKEVTIDGRVSPLDAAVALHLYTMDSPVYKVVNRSLRDGAALDQWSVFVQYTHVALQCLPPYNGTTYRGLDCAVDPDLYQPGSVITWRAFSSSTTSARVAKDFLGTPTTGTTSGTLFIVESTTARDVQAYSAFPAEDEVLFSVNTQFRVTGRISGGGMTLLAQAMGVDLSNTTVYELREVSLLTCGGVVRALTDQERVVGCPRVAAHLEVHSNEPFITVASLPVPLPGEDEGGGEDGSSRGGTYLLDIIAAETASHYPDILRLLLTAGAPANIGSPIATFVRHSTRCSPQSLKTLDALVTAGADPQAPDECVHTALTWAVGDELLHPFIEPLLRINATVDFPAGLEWRTALMVAASKGYATCVQFLFNAGSVVNQSDVDGHTALTLAAMHQFPNTVRILIECRADVNWLCGGHRRTPLSFAAERGCEEVVADLLKAGAVAEVVDGYGCTPWVWAQRNGHTVVTEQLEAAGAIPREVDSTSLALVVRVGRRNSHTDYTVIEEAPRIRRPLTL